MHRHTIGVTVCAALAISACGGGTSTGAPSSGGAAHPIARFLDEILPAGASGTLVAAHEGTRMHCEGFGEANREANVAARCNTVYDVMSMTKQFTATAILKLQMMGKLEVSDPISEHLGPVPDDKRAITVRRLLTHTSGLVESLGGDYEPLSREAMVTGALESKLRSTPGAEHHYSNLGYSLLAAIVESASGMDYERFLATQLFAPAGMMQTGYVLPDWNPDRIAVEYDPQGVPQGTPLDHAWADDGPYWNLRGNGGLLSTGRDMLRWDRALDRGTVLDRRSTRELFKARVREQEDGDSFYGYGWVIAPTEEYGRVAWHDGGNGWSFGLLTRLLEDRATVFWISNRYRDAGAGWNLARLEPRLTEGVAELILRR